MHILSVFFFPFFGFGFLMYFLLNLFLGWTMIGWVVALVWAVKTDVPVVVR
jgi:hypothetical protein